MSNLPIILVTGANQGLGFHACQHLARSGNYHVLLGSRDPKKGADAVQKILSADSSISKDKLETVALDITSDASIDAAAGSIKDKFGHLDILVNNAALGSSASKNLTLREHYADLFNVNVASQAIVTEKLLPLLKASLGAKKRVVFTSSVMGSTTLAQKPGQNYYATAHPVYRSTKAALNMHMVYYGNVLKDDGIAVLALCPGFCSTNLTQYGGPIPPEEGSKTIVKAATEESNEEMAGLFFDVTGKLPY